MYKDKYLKYKNKYFNLKKYNMAVNVILYHKMKKIE